MARARSGRRATLSNWKWDLSTQYGRNSLHYDVSNSNNASMGTSSPRNFDAGGLVFGQWTSNLDFFRELSLGGGRPLRTAIGAEFRLDQFEIAAGDSASWINGKQPILDGPNAGSSTVRPAPGAQGFPGFRPADEQDVTRNNYAVYARSRERHLAASCCSVPQPASRTTTISDRRRPERSPPAMRSCPQLALRGAVNTGFRAPSLGQSFFSSTATNLVAGQFLEIRTFPVSTPGARALGATDLKPEKSVNVSGGVTYDPSSRFSVSVDYYDIRIHDRIVFSENFIGPAIQAQSRGDWAHRRHRRAVLHERDRHAHERRGRSPELRHLPARRTASFASRADTITRGPK